MKPDRLNTCLQLVRWNTSTLAEALDVPADRVSRWSEGQEEIPSKIALWVEALCFVHEAAEESKPATPGAGFDQSPPLEHVPVYAYSLLRALNEGPVQLQRLFGRDDDAAVYFLISRGLAVRTGHTLAATPEGQAIGKVTAEGFARSET